jgi:hypothetical protein
MFLRTQRKLGAQLDLTVIGEHVPPRPWPLQADGSFDPYLRLQIADGCRWLELRAELRDIGSTQAEPYARMLDGVFCGGHWWSDPPCFAIVADPDPAPTSPASALPATDNALDAAIERAPELPTPVEFAPSVHRAATGYGSCAFLQTPDGQLELLCSGLTIVDRNEALQRYRWPSGEWLAAHAIPGPKARSEALSLVALPDEDGDGYSEFAVGDQASERNAGSRATILSGAVTIHDGRTGRELRSLRHEVSPTPAGDDHFGSIVMLCGDWDGDRKPELAVCSTASMGNGKDHCGSIEVRSIRNPNDPPLWSALGTDVMSTLTLRAVSRPKSGKATMAAAEIVPQILFTKEKYLVLSILEPDASGDPVRLTTKPNCGLAFLEGADAARLRLAAYVSMSYFEGLLVLERADHGWREVQRQPLRTDATGDASHQMVAVPDQDGRGRDDVVLVRHRGSGSPQIVLLAGEDLAVLARGTLPATIESVYQIDVVPTLTGQPTELFVLGHKKAPQNLVEQQQGQRLRVALRPR